MWTTLLSWGREPSVWGPHSHWLCFTPSLSKSFASLSFHHVCSGVYSFLLGSALSSCSCIVKSRECKASVSEGLKNISISGVCCQLLSSRGANWWWRTNNWTPGFLCCLQMPVSLLATERGKTNIGGVNNYIRNKSSCNTGSFKPDNSEIVWIITN